MRKGRDEGEKKTEGKNRGGEMMKIVATNVVANQPIGTPTARANNVVHSGH